MGRITASRKQLKPDPRYESLLASKFINCLMYDGKKSIAQHVFYDALDIIKEKMPDAEPIEVFTQAVENVKPCDRGPLAARRRCRLPGADAGEPQPAAVAGHPLDSAGRPREEGPRRLHQKLADELIAAYNREGAAVTKRENVHRMADANKAFAHFAW